MVVAIVVTFFPDIEILHTLLEQLNKQVTSIVVVDNCSGSALTEYFDRVDQYNFHKKLTFIPLSENTGIAAAQNKGIECAKQRFASDVILFDQDSIPSDVMVKNLLLAKELLISQGKKVAALGPRYLDIRQNNPPPFIRIEGLRLIRCTCNEENGIIPVDYLIASGCLIPIEVLNVVGVMEEQLFIDYVDIEWGLRAKTMGFQSYGACLAKMNHSLGEQPIIFMGKHIPLHSALRHYYHFRNAVWLYRQPWVKTNWKFVDGFRLVLKYIFYSIFAKPRGSQFKMMSLGIMHGLTKKMGKYKG